jgi:hypothetical protein
LALYDAAGRVARVARAAFTAQPGGGAGESVELPEGGAATARAFLWDSAGYAPLVPGESLELS